VLPAAPHGLWRFRVMHARNLERAGYFPEPETSGGRPHDRRHRLLRGPRGRTAGVGRGEPAKAVLR
jgi:hypothetical protein